MIKNIKDLNEMADKKKCSEKSCKEEIRVCIGSSCLSLGSKELQKNLQNEIKDKKLTDSFRVKGVGCSGLCANGTLVSHYNNATKKSTLYEKVESSDVTSFIETL